jgi:hypothetical protein
VISKVFVAIARLPPNKNNFAISFVRKSINRTMPEQKQCLSSSALFLFKKTKTNNSKLETSDVFSSYINITLRSHKTSHYSTLHENIQTRL